MKSIVPLLAAAMLFGCGPADDQGTAVTQEIASTSTSLTLDLPAPQGEEEAALAAEVPEAVPPPPQPEPAPVLEKSVAAPAPAPARPAPLVSAPVQVTPPPAAAEIAIPQPSGEPAAQPARSPLPEPVLARTIERIGYSCGEVVGTERVEGPRGAVYRINCSSGETYRGTTKRGRMYFRRWASAGR